MNVAFHLDADIDVFGDTGALVVSLTEEKRAQLLQRLQTAKGVYERDGSVTKMCFQDWDVDCVSSKIIDEDEYDCPSGTYFVLPEGIDVGDYEDDGPKVKLSHFVVWPSIEQCRWQGLHRYSDNEVFTASLDWDALRKLCEQEQPAGAL